MGTFPKRIRGDGLLKKNSGKETLSIIRLAELTGISKSTISRVVTKHPSVSEKTREKVEKAIEKYGYVPSISGRSLAGAKTGIIGLISPYIASGYAAEVISGATAEARSQGAHILCSASHNESDYLELLRDMSRWRMMDGILLIAPPDLIYKEKRPENTPQLVICSSKPAPKADTSWKELDTVTVANRKYQTELLEKFYESGCRSFIYFSGDDQNYDAHERFGAFKSFVEEKKLKWTSARGSYNGYEMMSAMKVEKLPDAIICFNDQIACGVYQYLKEKGLDNKIKLSGFDGDPSSETYKFSTVEVPLLQIGKTGVQRLFERINGYNEAKREDIIELKVRI